MKRIISLTLILAMLFSLVPHAQAETFSGSCGENLTWHYDESTKTLTISGTGRMDDYDTISYSGKVLQPWSDFTYTERIIVEEGVEHIGTCAFHKLWNVTEVSLPSTLTEIAQYAFYASSDLESIEIPESVIKIGWSAFENCSALKTAKLPSGLAEIPVCLFADCNALTSVTIPESVTVIGGGAFRGCYSLPYINIPEGVEAINDATFQSCSKLNGITLGKNIKSIGITAFDGCSSLTEINLPEGLVSLGMYSFKNCSSLTELTLPSTLISASVYSFMYCSSLESFYVSDGNPVFAAHEGVLYTADNSTLIVCPQSKSGSYSILNGTETIGEYAFSECYDITEIEIPSTVTTIGSNAMQRTGITELNLPNSVKHIEVSAFSQNQNLLSVTIPSSVEYLGEAVFEECRNLKFARIEEGLRAIREAAFSYCTSLETVYLPSTINSLGWQAFSASDVKNVYFYGPAPYLIDEKWTPCFPTHGKDGENYITDVTLYFIEGQADWTTPYWSGYPTVVWNPNDHTHSYSASTFAPTCAQAGYTLHACPCGESYTENIIPANGHNYTVQVISPTCTEGGYTMYHCEACGDQYNTDETEPTGHNYVPFTYSPTCLEAGYTIYTCICGDSYTTDHTAPTGHDFIDGVCHNCGVSISSNFTDVPSDSWFKSAVDFAVANGLMNGMGNNRFEPDSAMNRAMLVTVLWRYAGQIPEGENIFTDVPQGKWYSDAVAWASHNGIVGGVGNNQFAPEGNITREQLATILYRYSNSIGLDTSNEAILTRYSDWDNISSYAIRPLAWAVGAGLINGTNINGRIYLDPQGNATRAQVAAILMRFIENCASVTTSGYEAIIRKTMAQCGNNADGLLYDFDANGVKELVLIYQPPFDPQDPYYIHRQAYSVYTMHNDEVITLIEDQMLYAHAGGNQGWVGVVEIDGEIFFAAVSHVSTYECTYGQWMIYRINGTSHGLQTQVNFYCQYNDDREIDYTNSYCDFNGERLEYEYYQSWVGAIKEIETILGMGSSNLEALLMQLP